MSNSEIIGEGGICVAYSRSVSRPPGEHPCSFEQLLVDAQTDQDGQFHQVIRTIRCPLAITVTDVIDPIASKNLSHSLGKGVEVLGTSSPYEQPEQTPSMGSGCLYGVRGVLPRFRPSSAPR